MAAAFDEKDRRLLPRWRESRRTESGELATEDPGRDFFQPSRFAVQRNEWAQERTLAHASEFVGAAIVNRHSPDAREAAEQILREAPEPSNLRRLAERALHGIPPRYPQEELPEQARKRVAKLRHWLHDDPRNAIALVDLAREYAVLGRPDKATSVMGRAVALAPENRLVLRAACALYVHVGDPERAVHLLRRASATRSDSWLMAAEIGASSVAEKRPISAKTGLKLVASQAVAPFQIAELAGALATEELSAGSVRSAKKLFSAALVDPNENTVAQAEWARELVSGLPLEPRHFALLLSYEARAREKRQKGMWREALEEARCWLFDQPLSVEPATFGSYIAGVALDDQNEAERLARVGLRANATDRMLKNNLVVALAVNGKIEEATRIFKSIDMGRHDLPRRATFLATAGLLSYRQGAIEQGRLLYEQAMDMLSARGFERMKANAALYRAREELLVRGERAHEFARAAQALAKKSGAPETAAFLKVIEKLAQSHGVILFSV